MLTYNRQDMLPVALNSILNQTYKNFELIVINDASVDNTLQILQQYAKKDKRIKIVNNATNQGILKNRNLGHSLAKGDYIAWQDDDDISEPTKLEEQVAFMQEHKDIAVLGTEISLLGTKSMVYLWPTETIPERAEIAFLIGRLPVVFPTTMWRSDFFNKNNIKFNPDISLSEDFAIYDQVFAHGGKIMTLHKTLYQYRVHRSNPREYYVKMGILQKKIWRDRWFKFFPNSQYPDSQCKRLKYVKENNIIFNQKIVDDMYDKHCKTDIFNPTSYELVFVDDDGETQAVVVSKNTQDFYSHKFKKHGRVMSRKPFDSEVKILWEKEDNAKVYHYL